MVKGNDVNESTKWDLEANFGFENREYEGHSSKKSAGITPEESASWLSLLTFSWFTGMMNKAYSSHLETSDFFDLPEYDTPRFRLDDFTKYWEKELEKGNMMHSSVSDSQKDLESAWLLGSNGPGRLGSKDGKKPSLILALLLTFKWEVFLIIFLIILADSCLLAQSIVLRRLLLLMQGAGSEVSNAGSYSLPWPISTLGLLLF